MTRTTPSNTSGSTSAGTPVPGSTAGTGTGVPRRPSVSGWFAAVRGRSSGALASLAWGLVGCVGLLALWQLASVVSSEVPSPADGLSALGRMVAHPFYDAGANDKGIGVYLVTSLQRVFAGFALAAVVGVPVGLGIGAYRPAWQAINPVVQLLRPVSPLAWFPLLLATFENAGEASIYVIFITSLWPTLINTAAGVASVPADQRNVARVYHFSRVAYLRYVLVPNALPSMITGLRLSMGTAWTVIVAAEMLSGNSGIGFFVWDTYNAGNLPNVTAAIIVIGVVGLALDAILMRLARWANTEGPQS